MENEETIEILKANNEFLKSEIKRNNQYIDSLKERLREKIKRKSFFTCECGNETYKGILNDFNVYLICTKCKKKYNVEIDD